MNERTTRIWLREQIKKGVTKVDTQAMLDMLEGSPTMKTTTPTFKNQPTKLVTFGELVVLVSEIAGGSHLWCIDLLENREVRRLKNRATGLCIAWENADAGWIFTTWLEQVD